MKGLVFVLILLVVKESKGDRDTRIRGARRRNMAREGQGTFWHVSDFHLDFYYDSTNLDRTKVCPSSNEAEAENPGKWGDYRCDSPLALVKSSIEAMKEIESKPDFILWTGDDTLHTNDEERYLGTDKVIETIRNLTELLKDAFPNTIVHASQGNHDYHPKNQFPEGPNTILSEVAGMWKSWMTKEQSELFNETGYYSVSPDQFPNLLIISLNTPLWYTSNKLTDENTDPAGQFAWFEDELKSARANNKKVYVVGHIPPGYFELVDYKPWYYETFNAQFNKLIRTYSDVIVGQFFGHHHTDTFRMFYENKQPVSTLWITPGVTPWMTTLPGVDNGANNPGIRLFTFDKATMEPLDYTQYMLDLAQANEADNASWVKEYTASEAFQINDLSPQSFESVVQRLKNAYTDCPTDSQCDDFLQTFALYNSVSYNNAYCDKACQLNHVCSIVEVDYDDYLACVSNAGKIVCDVRVLTLALFVWLLHVR